MGGSKESLAAVYVEERFVQTEGFHQRRERSKDAANLSADGRVVSHANRKKDSVRTKSARRSGRHGAVNAERPRFVGRGTNDAAIADAADDDRFAAQLEMIALLDGRIEGVHVYVKDCQRCGHVGRNRAVGETNAPAAATDGWPKARRLYWTQDILPKTCLRKPPVSWRATPASSDRDMCWGTLVTVNGVFTLEIWKNVNGVWTKFPSKSVNRGSGTQIARSHVDGRRAILERNDDGYLSVIGERRDAKSFWFGRGQL
jgi:hypothetical protein